uniref:Uncharacterized protein n=1 Tax=Solanum tuberosum TaxID=4113 RepID=M1DUN4_SOLTU
MKDDDDDDEREKIGRIKGVHVDIPKEEIGEVVLCEENGMPSEIERKEKRDDSLILTLTHLLLRVLTLLSVYSWEKLMEDSSFDELNPKVVETTYLIEQVHVDEKNKS